MLRFGKLISFLRNSLADDSARNVLYSVMPGNNFIAIHLLTIHIFDPRFYVICTRKIWLYLCA